MIDSTSYGGAGIGGRVEEGAVRKKKGGGMRARLSKTPTKRVCYANQAIVQTMQTSDQDPMILIQWLDIKVGYFST